MRGVVLDIETALDRQAVADARRTGPSAFLRPWLHRITAASTLSFDFDARGVPQHFTLETALALAPKDEPDLLSFVEDKLSRLATDDVLITYNGKAHDLPVLRNRRLAWWLFEASNLTSVFAHEQPKHQDVMRELCANCDQRWPALIDVCAATGIPCDATLKGRTASPAHPLMIKGQTDVCATLLLYLMWQTSRSGAPEILVNGWTALADHLIQTAPTTPHLTQFATAPRALEARQRSKGPAV